MTRQGRAVLDALQRAEGFRSAQEIHAELRAAGESVGLTTVYRHLQSMADTALIDAMRTDDGEARYRWCATRHHHHHVVCRDCGRSEEVEAPEVEAWAAALADRLGYADVSHTLEVWGRCGDCRQTTV